MSIKSISFNIENIYGNKIIRQVDGILTVNYQQHYYDQIGIIIIKTKYFNYEIYIEEYINYQVNSKKIPSPKFTQLDIENRKIFKWIILNWDKIL